MKVGVVGNPSYRDLGSILAQLAAAGPRLGFTYYAEDRLRELWPAPKPELLNGKAPLDCLITLGGDGTLLRGARARDREAHCGRYRGRHPGDSSLTIRRFEPG